MFDKIQSQHSVRKLYYVSALLVVFQEMLMQNCSLISYDILGQNKHSVPCKHGRLTYTHVS